MSPWARLQAWRRARYWRARQLPHLLTMVQGDHRWLGGEVADALTERYLAALSPIWQTISFEPIEQLRPRIGLDPHARGRPAGRNLPPASLPQEQIEAVAQLVYEAMAFEQSSWVPWVERGNAHAQEHARRVAWRILDLSAPTRDNPPPTTI